MAQRVMIHHRHAIAILAAALTALGAPMPAPAQSPPLQALAQAPAAAAPRPAGATPGEIVKAAPAADWTAIAANDLLVMDLTPDASGARRRVVIQLMPAPFSQGWVGNMRLPATAHWWDGTSVYRVQDNYVAQWGDGEDDKAKAKPLPSGLVTVGEGDYTASLATHPICDRDVCKDVPEVVGLWSQGIEYSAFEATGGWSHGWPVAFERVRSGKSTAWPIHCYGMVGVARDLSPDTGTGAELYAVIGQSPRPLDRNIALVGRVIEGIAYLSSLPRGPAPMGVYTAPSANTPIRSVRLASEMPAVEQPHFQYLSTRSASFTAYVEARVNHRDAFFVRPAGALDICNATIPIRQVPVASR